MNSKKITKTTFTLLPFLAVITFILVGLFGPGKYYWEVTAEGKFGLFVLTPISLLGTIGMAITIDSMPGKFIGVIYGLFSTGLLFLFSLAWFTGV